MAFKIVRGKTSSTPYILIDEKNGYMKLQGVSFHENTVEFFKEVTDWLGGFLKTEFTAFTFDCELEYFNSSTAKLLLNMLGNMNKAASAEKKVTVNWITSKENEIIIECGEDFRDGLDNIEFNLITN